MRDEMKDIVACCNEIVNHLQDRFCDSRQFSQCSMQCLSKNEGKTLIVIVHKSDVLVASAMVNLADEKLQEFNSDDIATAIFEKLSNTATQKKKSRILKFLDCFLAGCVKILFIFLIWQLGELYLYDTIQPRAIDDIIGLILSYYVFKAQFQKDNFI